jgi:hypothetical protein
MSGRRPDVRVYAKLLQEQREQARRDAGRLARVRTLGEWYGRHGYPFTEGARIAAEAGDDADVVFGEAYREAQGRRVRPDLTELVAAAREDRRRRQRGLEACENAGRRLAVRQSLQGTAGRGDVDAARERARSFFGDDGVAAFDRGFRRGRP